MAVTYYTLRDPISSSGIQASNNNGSDLLHFERSGLLEKPTSL